MKNQASVEGLAPEECGTMGRSDASTMMLSMGRWSS